VPLAFPLTFFLFFSSNGTLCLIFSRATFPPNAGGALDLVFASLGFGGLRLFSWYLGFYYPFFDLMGFFFEAFWVKGLNVIFPRLPCSVLRALKSCPVSNFSFFLSPLQGRIYSYEIRRGLDSPSIRIFPSNPLRAGQTSHSFFLGRTFFFFLPLLLLLYPFFLLFWLFVHASSFTSHALPFLDCSPFPSSLPRTFPCGWLY